MRSNGGFSVGKRNYQFAVELLNELQTNHANIMAVKASGCNKNKMNILEMKKWLTIIGCDIKSFNDLNIIHITGTKGKGSTAVFTQSILKQYPEKFKLIGLFTSPHLKTIRERIMINGIPISEEKFSKFFFEIWDKLESSCPSSSLESYSAKPSYFKYLTLLAFYTFIQEGCTPCIVEVGVGGAFDSTNVVSNPVACGVSLIGIDHTAILGNTIQEIAWNKGGIFKKNSPAFTIKAQPPSGLAVLEERALEVSTSLAKIPNYNVLDNLKLGIPGSFQKSNASLAVALANECLKKVKIHTGIEVSNFSTELPDRFIKGLVSARLDGRCQTIKNGNITWYIDGAHTTDSIIAASGWFNEQVKNSPNKKILLFNQQTRDSNSLLKQLHNRLKDEVKFQEAIFTTNITWKSGSYSPELVSYNISSGEVKNLKVQIALSQTWKGLDSNTKTMIMKDIESAVNYIKTFTKPVDIYATGSLHLVGGLLVVLDKN